MDLSGDDKLYISYSDPILLMKALHGLKNDFGDINDFSFQNITNIDGKRDNLNVQTNQLSMNRYSQSSPDIATPHYHHHASLTNSTNTSSTHMTSMSRGSLMTNHPYPKPVENWLQWALLLIDEVSSAGIR